MICHTAYTLLVVGLASITLAEPTREPYQPKFARMATRDILGLRRRAVEGYSPTEELCGAGNTCAEACGRGFKQCASKDGKTHCFNSLKKQTCCPSGSGDSCDDGYFCTADDKGETWCCPDGLGLKECAQKYNIPGPLTSQAPLTSATPTTSTATTKATTKDVSTGISTASTPEPTTTGTRSKKPESAESTASSKTAQQTSSSKSESEETSTATPSTSRTTPLVDVSSALLSTETAAVKTTALEVVPSPTFSSTPIPSSTSSIGVNGGSTHGSANGLVLLIAGAVAVLV